MPLILNMEEHLSLDGKDRLGCFTVISFRYDPKCHQNLHTFYTPSIPYRPTFKFQSKTNKNYLAHTLVLIFFFSFLTCSANYQNNSLLAYNYLPSETIHTISAQYTSKFHHVDSAAFSQNKTAAQGIQQPSSLRMAART